MTTHTPHDGPIPAPTVGLIGPGDLWYKDAIIYSLNVESFQDGNADGIGDFAGLTGRLDYLHALGVTCIWLGPFYPSPSLDNRYDVADYYGIDPRLGSLGDFVDFLRVARERGIRVMVDLVVNHTSNQHPWFRAARSDPASPYRDYYVWADTPPPNSDQGVVFPGVETSTWTRDDEAGAYYFHRFYRHQPDLNLANPRVREEIRKVVGFWLEIGVSGFRVDAAPYLIERKGISSAQVEARRPHTFFRYLRGFLSWRRGDAAMLAEANVPMQEVEEYVGAGDKLQMLFNFWLNQHLWLALATERAQPLTDAIRRLAPIPPTCQWANFLRNHDELDLGRLSLDDRQRVYDAFAPSADMRLYGRGIRRRTAAMFGANRARIELAYSLMFSLTGTPVLYYGDEILMGEDLSLPERESVRTPMQWSSDANGGFSSAPAQEVVRPVVVDGPLGAQHANVAAQQRDPDSFLNWLRRALGVRKTCRELSWGTMTVVDTDREEVSATMCQWQGRALICVHNLSDTARTAHLALSQTIDLSAADEVLSDRKYAETELAQGTVSLAGFGYRWFRVTLPM